MLPCSPLDVSSFLKRPVPLRGVEAIPNPELLVWARESAGLKLEVVAKRTQVNEERLRAWEQDRLRPTVKQLRRLATIYNVRWRFSTYLSHPVPDRGAFKSSDGGQSWTAAGSGLPPAIIAALAIDPANPAVVYAAVHETTQNSGVFKTTDGGQSWAAANSGLPNASVTALAIHSFDSATVYAATEAGIYKTIDGGIGWTEANTRLTAAWIRTLAVDPSNPARIYAGTWGNGVSKTTNGGQSWSNSGLPNPFLRVLAIDTRNPAILYAGVAGFQIGGVEFTTGPFLRGGLFKSLDGGVSWVALDSVFTGKDVQALAIDPADSATLYASIGTSPFGVYKSTDGGVTWTGPLGAGGGPFETPFRLLAVDPINSGTVYAGGTADTLFKSTDGGASWSHIDPRFGGNRVTVLAIDPVDPDVIYAVAGGVYKSTDGGETWTHLSSSPVRVNLVIDPTNPATLYGTRFGIFKSVNGGASWRPINIGLTTRFVEVLAIDPTNPTIIYAGTHGGGVFKSTNGGEIWQPTGAN